MKVDDAIGSIMLRGDESEPAVVAARALMLAPSVDDDFLLWAMTERVKWSQRNVRNVSAPSQGAAGKSKWAAFPVVAPFVNKFLADCTADDLAMIVAEYDGQIAASAAKRDGFVVLLRDLQVSGCCTVGELRALSSVAA